MDIDVSGGISATFSPVVGNDWTINPQLGISAHLDRAVAKTAVGDIDITGHVRGAINNLANNIRGPAEAKLATALDVRKDVERLWNEINSVNKLTDDPPTWLHYAERGHIWSVQIHARHNRFWRWHWYWKRAFFVQKRKARTTPRRAAAHPLNTGSL